MKYFVNTSSEEPSRVYLCKVHSSSEIFGCFLVSIGAAALIKNLVYNIFHGFVLLAITNRIAISSIKDDDRDAEAS